MDMSLALGLDEIHVWQAPFSDLTCELSHMAALLCQEEQDRAARFHFERDREQFVLSRGILRLLLANYAGSEPEEIAFCYSPNGKPALSGESTLQFNLSHTTGMAVYAFAHHRRLGVDVERDRELSGLDQIAAQIFTPAELAAYYASDLHRRQRCFFHGWTRKEAFVKACGEGWSRSPKTFAVSLATNEPVRLLHIEGDPWATSCWRLYDITTSPSYVAALAVESGPCRTSQSSRSDPSYLAKEPQLLFRSISGRMPLIRRSRA